MNIAKLLVVVLGFIGSIEAFANENILWGVEGAEKDVQYIVDFQNTASERAKNSNEFINLDSVIFDKSERFIVYTFSLKHEEADENIKGFIKHNEADLFEIDCGNSNFALENVGNRYLLKDIKGDILSKVETSKKICNLRKNILYKKDYH